MQRIDHVTVAWSDLDALADEFDALGLAPEYGGVHDNGVTHMSVLGFDDGSYVELISTTEPGRRSPLWHDHIAGDAGPTAWAVEVEDVAAAAKRAIDAGLSVNGPRYMTRERPDGTLLEWDLAFVDGHGATLPFVIADRTPREHRVRPTGSVSGGPLSGVAEVVVGVESIDPATEPFRRLHRFPTPEGAEHDGWDATLASFPGRRVTLAAPRDDGWLAGRLERFGPSPCAFLVGTDDLDAAMDAYPLGDPGEWFGRRVAWFESDLLDGTLGVVEDTVGRNRS